MRGTKNFHFNDVEWLYRVSYNPDNPHELLISGQKKGGYIFSWIFNPSKKYLYDLSDNGDVAYKAALFNGKCYYAKRGNGGFEDRHIVMAQNLRISELSYDDIVGNSQEANSPSMLKMLQNFTSEQTMKPWQNAKQFAIHANIGRLPPALEWGNA